MRGALMWGTFSLTLKWLSSSRASYLWSKTATWRSAALAVIMWSAANVQQKNEESFLHWMSLFACGIVSVRIHFKLNGPHNSAFLELWMIYFNGVNELQWKELAEKLVKPFTHHRTLCRRACLWFYRFHACRCGLGLDTSILYLLCANTHTHTLMLTCTCIRMCTLQSRRKICSIAETQTI